MFIFKTYSSIFYRFYKKNLDKNASLAFVYKTEHKHLTK